MTETLKLPVGLAQDAKRPLLSTYETSEHLRAMGYSEKGITLMVSCGNHSGDFILSNCYNCGYKVLRPVNYACNLRTCSKCSPKRSKRLFKKYARLLLNSGWRTCRGSKDSLYFLTISPKNYNGIKEGLDSVQISFKKFLRTKYIKERIKGGLWVIESKNRNKFGESKGWNVHIHVLFYGRRLDNAIRGHCYDCGQNYMKYDRVIDKYYCANRRCNSQNVIVKLNSKIVQLYKNCSGEAVNIDIKEFMSPLGALNYGLKYISQNEDSFESSKDLAEYIYYSKGRRLISTFGTFYDKSHIKFKMLCPCCKGFLNHTFDRLVINTYLGELRKKPVLDENEKFLVRFYKKEEVPSGAILSPVPVVRGSPRAKALF